MMLAYLRHRKYPVRRQTQSQPMFLFWVFRVVKEIIPPKAIFVIKNVRLNILKTEETVDYCVE